MRKKAFLLVIVLLVLTKSALSIEVEPNNNSAQANKLGKENFGQLKKNSDVDFFSIDTSKRGDSDISISFACDSRATASVRNGIGWYVGIYNPKGEEQATYQIKPEDCVTGAADSKGPYSFKFYSDKNFSTYYLSVVGDCVPTVTVGSGDINDGTSCDRSNSATYSIKDNENNVIKNETPYQNISDSKVLTELKPNTKVSADISSFYDVDFFEIKNPTSQSKFPATEVSIEFSCKQNSTRGSNYGWIASLWKHYSDGSKADEVISSPEIMPTDCTDPKVFSDLAIPINNTGIVASYYIAIQSACIAPPKDTKSELIPNYEFSVSVSSFVDRYCNVNTTPYKLKIGDIVDPDARSTNPIVDKNKLSDSLLKSSTTIGVNTTGQINSLDDNDIYFLDSDGSTDIPLIFSCSSLAVRQTNNWKLDVYNDANELVPVLSSKFINGSNCASGFVGDKGGYSFILPKGSSRYYLSIKPVCDSLEKSKKECQFDTAEYSISRDVNRVYAIKKLVNPPITKTTADLKLAGCGLNKNAVINVKAENVNLANALKNKANLPINVQIGDVACRVLAPTVAPQNPLIGDVTDKSEIIDSPFIAKDNATIILSGCDENSSEKAKISLTASKLDLQNLNSDKLLTTVPISIKVGIGDFECEAKESFYISEFNGETYYSIVQKETTTSTGTTTTPVITPDSFEPAWLTTKKNLGATLQMGQINAPIDTHVYQVDTGTTDANLIFTCLNSVRYQNDWKLLIYDSTKTLKSTTIINGSSCGLGQIGDTGAYQISLTKDSPSYYLVVKSACESDDKTCKIDNSQYELKRVTPAQAAAITAAKPCFGTGCTTVTQPVKPFFK